MYQYAAFMQMPLEEKKAYGQTACHEENQGDRSRDSLVPSDHGPVPLILSPPWSHHVAQIVIWQPPKQSHGCQIWQELVFFIGSIEKIAHDTEPNHDEMQMLGLPASVDNQVRDEDRR